MKHPAGVANNISCELEVTITHNTKIVPEAEIRELYQRRLIALDWGRKGPDLHEYSGRARSHVKLFHRIASEGAAVIAAYHGAMPNRGDRLIGWVEPGSSFVRLNGLLCLRLTKTVTRDSTANFLGNLVPRQCAVQECGARAGGRLAALVLGRPLPRNFGAIHHRDVEWLVTNYLLTSGLCECV